MQSPKKAYGSINFWDQNSNFGKWQNRKGLNYQAYQSQLFIIIRLNRKGKKPSMTQMTD